MVLQSTKINNNTARDIMVFEIGSIFHSLVLNQLWFAQEACMSREAEVEAKAPGDLDNFVSSA